MKFKFQIEEERLVKAVKIIVVPPDPEEEPEYRVEGELDMETQVFVVPDKVYEGEIKDVGEGKIEIWLNDTFALLDVPADLIKEETTSASADS